MQDRLEALSHAVEGGDDQETVRMVKEALDDGVSATEILEEGLVPGIQALGKLFKDGQVYLPEILISVRAMDKGVQELKPYFGDVSIRRKGTIVLGTVEGDLHDIGKNLVRLMLESGGFTVEDLGVDVSADSFVAAVGQHQPSIVAMSTLLTITMSSMSEVVKALDVAGLRDRVKIIIGGAPITREFADEIGADGYADDCVSAVDEATRLMQT